MSDLPDFEGSPVRRSTVKITRAGDGLSEALKIAPEAFHHGDEVYFVLRGLVTQVNHVPVSPLDADLIRVHTLVCQDITQVDAADVDVFLDQANERLKLAREEEAGISRLGFDGDDEDGGDEADEAL
jgi:hypothetical protein